MSAAPAVFPAPGPRPSPAVRGGRPRHLRLVRPGEPVPQEGRPDAGRPWGEPTSERLPAARLRPVSRPGAGSTRGRARLTRRGRLAATVGATLAVAVATAMLVGLMGSAGAAPSEQTVVVQPGQTLSEVAAEQLPELPLDRAVVEIQLANRLSTTQVAAGQELVLPDP